MASIHSRKFKVILGSALFVVTAIGFQNCAKFDAVQGGGYLSNPSLANINDTTVGPLTPDVAMISETDTLQITQTNGADSGDFVVVAGSGSVNPVTGLYTPYANNTDAIIGRPDANGNWSYTFVKVASPGMPMALSPAAVLLGPGQKAKLSATGGTPPYFYSISAGSHSTLDSVTGIVTAGVYEETLLVTATDADGKTAISSVEIKNGTSPSMAVLHTPNPMISGKDVTFVVFGGTAPYTLELVSGGGTVVDQTYSPGNYLGVSTFKITDAHGQIIHMSSSVIDDPTIPYVAGTQTFSTPGTYTFTVPAYHTLSVVVKGAGGGGGGRSNGPYTPGSSGGAGAVTSFNANLIANAGGGGAGGAWLGRCGYTGAAGTASGGAIQVTGGGSAGGAPGAYGIGDCGGYGGAGGRVEASYIKGDFAIGTTITVVIGAGGASGYDGGGSHSAAVGTAGAVILNWN